MDYPFLVGFVVLGVVWLIGSSVERLKRLAMPAAVVAAALLIGEGIAIALR